MLSLLAPEVDAFRHTCLFFLGFSGVAEQRRQGAFFVLFLKEAKATGTHLTDKIFFFWFSFFFFFLCFFVLFLTDGFRLSKPL